VFQPFFILGRMSPEGDLAFSGFRCRRSKPGREFKVRMNPSHEMKPLAVSVFKRSGVGKFDAF